MIEEHLDAPVALGFVREEGVDRLCLAEGADQDAATRLALPCGCRLAAAVVGAAADPVVLAEVATAAAVGAVVPVVAGAVVGAVVGAAALAAVVGAAPLAAAAGAVVGLAAGRAARRWLPPQAARIAAAALAVAPPRKPRRERARRFISSIAFATTLSPFIPRVGLHPRSTDCVI